MPLLANREALAEYATSNDVQSLTGLFLAGFERRVQGLTAVRITDAQANAGAAATAAARAVEHAGVEAENAKAKIAAAAGAPAKAEATSLADFKAAQLKSAQRLAVLPDLGGPQLVPTRGLWGPGNWGAQGKPAHEFVLDLNLTDESPEELKTLLVTAAKYEDPLPAVAKTAFHGRVARLLALVPDQFSFNTTQNTVIDERHSRLIRRMDLTEWISIPNRDILYYVISEAEGERHQAPLGRATVWVKGSAQVHIARVKTAKSFVRGEITRQLKARELEPDLEGLYRAFFDVDAEDAFSSNGGTC